MPMNALSTSWREPAVRSYTLVCLAALGVLTLTLIERGAVYAAAVPLAIGVLGLIIGWQSASVLLLLGLSFVELNLRQPWIRPRGAAAAFGLSEVLMAGSILAYVMAHYRLQALLIHTGSPDPRRQARGADAGKVSAARPRRSLALVSSQEIVQMVLSLPIWVSLALLVWLLLPVGWNELGFPFHIWRTLVLTWFLGIGVLVGAGVVSYLTMWRMSPAEATLYLEDDMWLQTRSEQRLTHSWLARARQRRKGTS